jgi:diguanylate cyclase (GGDEF)-like protein/PAS domain S-box-containing protein
LYQEIDLPSSSKLPNVLIVDDREENLHSMQRLLEDEIDANIFLAQSGQEGLLSLNNHDFAVVLLDVQMPEMNGFEMAKLMKLNPATSLVPIIFVTAISKEEHYVLEGYNTGAIDYISKPVEPIILLNKVSIFIALKKSHDALQAANQRNKLLLESVSDGVIGVDANGKICFSNHIAAKIMRIEEEKLFGQSLFSFIHHDSVDADTAWQSSIILKMNKRGVELHIDEGFFYRTGQAAIPIEYRANAMYEDEEYIGSVITFQDITARQESLRQLQELATFDTLTGLQNRNTFVHRVKESISRCERGDQAMFAVLFIDLDHFKEINDSMGHMVGDDLLKSVSQRLVDSVRDEDSVSRLGGDEFAVVAEGISHPVDTAKVAQKIITALEEPHIFDHHEVTISPSIGVASYPNCGETVETLLQAADAAMYVAKSKGRNNYQFYIEEMNDNAMLRLQLESCLRHAIEREELTLYYQPQIDIVTEKVVAMEALLRWNNPELGRVSPAEFIPIAEETGVIKSIGEWVMRTACEENEKLVNACDCPVNIRVAVNVSLIQLRQADFVNQLRLIVHETGISANNLEVEVTESVMADDADNVVDCLQSIRDMGVKIAMDDFGTGYSSLGYLKRLPLDVLKIDQIFISDIGVDKQGESIVKTIIAMAHHLGLEVIAEGVENKVQLDFLREHNCNMAQGYFFSSPLPLEQAVKYLCK